MDRADALKHAEEWVHSWNARNIDQILSHYAEHARFVTPTAEQVTGSAVVEGREALRAYWIAALQGAGSLEFELEHVIWDQAQHELVIVYLRKLGGRDSRACEFFRFDAHGHVVAGEAMYGAAGS